MRLLFPHSNHMMIRFLNYTTIGGIVLGQKGYSIFLNHELVKIVIYLDGLYFINLMI